jgi:hypothetical protein
MQLIVFWRQEWWLQLVVVYTRYLLARAFVFALELHLDFCVMQRI